jgi:hypothetical protein
MKYDRIINIEQNIIEEINIDSIYNQISHALPYTEIISISHYSACFSILCYY